MQIVLAHSDKDYISEFLKKLLKKDLKEVYIFNNGFDALAHIIKNHSKLIIIEDNLPDLNANDIKKAMLFKGIKSKLVIIKNKNLELHEIEQALALD